MRIQKRICVVIPAFNEGEVLKDVIENATIVFSRSKHVFEIVVVDDGSTDNTFAQADLADATVVISHIINSGAGRATATGLRYAEINHYDMAATMDADGQHLPEDVVAGVEIALEKKTDLLIGSRLIDSEGMSRVKILGNKGLTFVTKMLFGINTTDSQSGLRIFSKSALEQLRWSTSGYEFCSEMLWRAKELNLKIDEYPIQAIYTEYSKSKGQSNWNAINIIKSLLARRISELFG